MNIKKLKLTNNMTIEYIMECNEFVNPVVDFILYNDFINNGEVFIGVHEKDNPALNYVYFYDRKEAVAVNELKFVPEDEITSDLFRKNLESYFFIELNRKEAMICYISLDFHIKLWKFIETLDRDQRCKYQAFRRYVNHGKDFGVNHALLNIYSDSDLVDIINDFEYVLDEDDLFKLLELFNAQVIKELFKRNKQVIRDYLDTYRTVMGEQNEK